MAQPRVGCDRSGRPATVQGFRKASSLRRDQFGGKRRKTRAFHRVDACLVELLILDHSDALVPVPEIID
jgi:hypothetical protein